MVRFEFPITNICELYTNTIPEETIYICLRNPDDIKQVNAKINDLITIMENKATPTTIDLNLQRFIHMDNSSPYIGTLNNQFHIHDTDLLKEQQKQTKSNIFDVIYEYDTNLVNKNQISIYQYEKSLPTLLKIICEEIQLNVKNTFHVIDFNNTIHIMDKIKFISYLAKHTYINRILWYFGTENMNTTKTKILKFKKKAKRQNIIE